MHVFKRAQPGHMLACCGSRAHAHTACTHRISFHPPIHRFQVGCCSTSPLLRTPEQNLSSVLCEQMRADYHLCPPTRLPMCLLLLTRFLNSRPHTYPHAHTSQDGAVKTPYTMQQLQRYIKFARTLTPRITLEAEKVMVQEYIKLRQNDASSLTKYETLHSRQSVSSSNRDLQ